MSAPKVLLSKVSKRGFSKSIGSSFGFGSWTVGETTFEIEIDPPLDLTTAEGKEEYKKIKDSLTKMCYKALQEDIEYNRKQDKEFDASIIKRESYVKTIIESESN